ncbi:MAG: DUF302 domain-containing protein [Fidelibacterota bacterium]
MSYGFFKVLNEDFDKVEEQVRTSLIKNGFGVVTEIDVSQTFKNKLNIDFKPYKILGACNPHYAHQALLKESNIGLLLPCNVIIEDNLDGTVKVGAIDAEKMLGITGQTDLSEFAKEVNDLLINSLENL